MAKILPGLAVHKISGTIAGTTYQNWRGLLVARAKPTPTNVQSPRQTFIRALMSLLSRAWRDTLTQGLRTAWNQRAANYPWLDVFGNERKMTGLNLYIKQNLVLLDHGLVRQDQPVPDVMPAELVDVTLEPDEGFGLRVTYPGVAPAVITAQSPFVALSIAGGFLDILQQEPDEDIILSQCLPPGRVHQKSDFRHVLYHDDQDVSLQPTVFLSVQAPSGQTKNFVVVLQRYNKFGNFSVPVLFSAVRTQA